MTLKKDEVKKLSLYKLSCDKTKLDLKDTKIALDECYATPPAVHFWQEPAFVIGVGVGGVVLGILVKGLVDSMVKR